MYRFSLHSFYQVPETYLERPCLNDRTADIDRLHRPDYAFMSPPYFPKLTGAQPPADACRPLTMMK
jgi:hypothetical protein